MINLPWTPRIADLIEELDERQAIVDQNPPFRSFTSIGSLEAAATAALRRSERFPGEHWCASTVLAKDIPRYEAIARAQTPIDKAPRSFRTVR